MSAGHASSVADGVPLGPLSVDDLDRLVKGLPPQQRAVIVWAPRELRAAIDVIRRSSDLSTEELATAAERIFQIVTPVIEPVFSWLGQRRIPEVATLWEKELGLLRDFLSDSAAVHAAEWTFRSFETALRSVLSSASQSDLTEALGALGTDGLPSALYRSEPGAFFRAQALLMAAIAEAEDRGNSERAAELVDSAFLEMATVVDLLGRAGFSIDPYANESDVDRGARLLSYVQDVRDGLTAEDIQRTVAAGRLSDLR